MQSSFALISYCSQNALRMPLFRVLGMYNFETRMRMRVFEEFLVM
jgi:hypothetical protein